MRRTLAILALAPLLAALAAGCSGGPAITAGGGYGGFLPTTTGSGTTSTSDTGSGGATGSSSTGSASTTATGGAGGGGSTGSTSTSSSTSTSTTSTSSSTSSSSTTTTSSSSTTSTTSTTTTSSSTSSTGPTPCTTNADCSGATSCQIGPNAAGTALERHCAPNVGAQSTGVICASNADCRSGLCLGGFCASPCSSLADCSQAGTCASRTITVGGLSGAFPLCVVAACTATSQCDPGEVCSQLQTIGGNIQAFCRQSIAGAAVGASCTTGATCATALCPTWIGSCTEACAKDADCGVSGEICVDMWSSGTSRVEGCAPGCGRAADCGSGKACVYASDTPGDRVRFMCATPSGTDTAGASCATQNKCASGLCLTNTLNGQTVDQICTQPCVTSADCPAGLSVCEDVTTSTPSGNGTQIIRLCNHP